MAASVEIFGGDDRWVAPVRAVLADAGEELLSRSARGGQAQEGQEEDHASHLHL